MNKLPVINARRLEKVLFKLGFEKIRQRGSHVFYRHSDGRTTTIPHHKGRDISKPLLKEILNDIGLEPFQFISLLK